MRRLLIVALTLAGVAAPSTSAGRPGPPVKVPPPVVYPTPKSAASPPWLQGSEPPAAGSKVVK